MDYQTDMFTITKGSSLKGISVALPESGCKRHTNPRGAIRQRIDRCELSDKIGDSSDRQSEQ